MKIEYKVMKGGVGVYLILDMEVKESSLPIDMIEVVFSSNISSYYNEGRPFIEKAFAKYKDMILSKSRFQGISVIVNEIESHNAHYQVETFYGATVRWIKEYFEIEIPEVQFYRDNEKSKFIFDI